MNLVMKLYKQKWKTYEIVAQLNRQTEEYRIALFLYSIGTQAVKTYNGFDLSQEDKRNLDAIIAAFDRYAIRETNETFERYLFNKREQQEGESIDQYVAELRILAQSCNFYNCLHDSLTRDRTVLGIKDSGARKRLLQQQQLTLQRCFDICKTSEASNTQIKSLGQSVRKKYEGSKKKACVSERPEIARQEGASTTYLQVLWRKSKIWPATLSRLGSKLFFRQMLPIH